ncbi:MAG: NAD(P)/FAD-dependent oxidoreductase, partial [Rudaea sp.]
YITELIAHDTAGGALAQITRQYQQLFFSFYRNMLALYRDQYVLFGDARVMAVKVLWDYCYYWGVLAPLVIGGHQTDCSLFATLQSDLIAVEALNTEMQALFRNWHGLGHAAAMPNWLDQQDLDWFERLNSRLHEPLDGAGFRARLREHIDLLHGLACAITDAALHDAPPLNDGPLPSLAKARCRPALFAHMSAAVPSPQDCRTRA